MVFKYMQSLDNRGNAMLEVALVIPFILFTTFAVIEAARAISLKMALSTAAYEGARAATKRFGLESRCMTETQIPTQGTEMARVYGLINQIVDLGDYPNQQVAIQLDYACNGDTQNVVSVRISSQFESLSGLYPAFPVLAEAKLAYLYPQAT